MKYRKIISALDTKVPGDRRSGKELNCWIKIGGRKVTRVTYPKQHRGDMPIGTLRSIQKQLQLNNKQFEDFIECPMTRTDYENHLRDLIENGTL